MSRTLRFELKYDVQSHKVFILEPVIGVVRVWKWQSTFGIRFLSGNCGAYGKVEHQRCEAYGK